MVMSIIQYMSKYVKSIFNVTNDSLKEINFFELTPDITRCDKCNKEYRQGALDFLASNFVCPVCENGKDPK